MFLFQMIFDFLTRLQEREADPNSSASQLRLLQLATDKAALEAAKDDLEKANSQLTAANQDLETANSKLVSTNKNLEIANKKLTTTNQDLEKANNKLTVTYQDLEKANIKLREDVALLRQQLSDLEAESSKLGQAAGGPKRDVAVRGTVSAVRICPADSLEERTSLKPVDEGARKHSKTGRKDGGSRVEVGDSNSGLEAVLTAGKDATSRRSRNVDSETGAIRSAGAVRQDKVATVADVSRGRGGVAAAKLNETAAAGRVREPTAATGEDCEPVDGGSAADGAEPVEPLEEEIVVLGSKKRKMSPSRSSSRSVFTLFSVRN